MLVVSLWNQNMHSEQLHDTQITDALVSRQLLTFSTIRVY